jgi:hypothetical protein
MIELAREILGHDGKLVGDNASGPVASDAECLPARLADEADVPQEQAVSVANSPGYGADCGHDLGGLAAQSSAIAAMPNIARFRCHYRPPK